MVKLNVVEAVFPELSVIRNTAFVVPRRSQLRFFVLIRSIISFAFVRDFVDQYKLFPRHRDKMLKLLMVQLSELPLSISPQGIIRFPFPSKETSTSLARATGGSTSTTVTSLCF
jgi:hypothetical protein